jgi:hypothetical protein
VIVHGLFDLGERAECCLEGVLVDRG